jgi:lipopolysaccharide transport system permease protein
MQNIRKDVISFAVYPNIIEIRMQAVIVLEPGHRERHYWRELWRYRELFAALALRDLSVRYKQTVIGILWAFLRPLLTVLVFTIVFGKIAKLPSEGTTPYALMVFVGMLPWTFFGTALSEAGVSLITSSNLISKVYFPRMVVPCATLVVAFADFMINLLILVAMMFWYGVAPGPQLLLLPFFMVLGWIATLGPALWIAAITVKYRDFRFVTPFVVQLGLYISPVGFSSSIVPDTWRLLYSLNPMVGVIDGFRWCFLGSQSPIDWPSVGLGTSVAILLLWFGFSQFRKMEKSFADLI